MLPCLAYKVLGIKPRTSGMLGKELGHIQLYFSKYYFQIPEQIILTNINLLIYRGDLSIKVQ